MQKSWCDKIRRRGTPSLGKVGIFLLGALLVAISLISAVTAQESTDPESAGWESVTEKRDLSVVHSDEQGILLELVIPEYEVREQVVDGVVYHAFEVEGWAQTSEAGQPQLPVRRLLLAVPDGSNVQVHIVESETELLPGAYHVLPAPRYVVDIDPLSPVSEEQRMLPREEFVLDEGLYSTDAFYPEPTVEVVKDGTMRSQRVVNLALRPFQVNPARGQVRLHSRVLVQVDFSGQSEAGIAGGSVQNEQRPGSFEAILRSKLVNGGATGGQTSRIQAPQSVTSWTPPSPAYKVSVTADGMYKMDYDYLAAAGLPVDTLDPKTFRLFDMGQEIAIGVVGEGNGQFQSGEYILFYGRKENTKYTDQHVYWLTFGGKDGRRMGKRNGTPSGAAPVADSFKNTVHLEANIDYLSSMPGEDELERWYWDVVVPYINPTQKDYNTTLSPIVSNEYSATLRFPLLGAVDDPIDPDHHARLFVNGHSLADLYWDGYTWLPFEGDFDQSWLIAGVNTIRLRLPNDTGVVDDYGNAYDIVYTDWIELDFYDQLEAVADRLDFGYDMAGPREFRITNFTTETIKLFDVTNAADVQRIEGSVKPGYELWFEDTIADESQYIALAESVYLTPAGIEGDEPSDWNLPDHGADYIIITHPAFLAQAQDLADYRRDRGLRVVVVDVLELYDTFSYGIFDPHAIKDFLVYAYEQWQPPAPTYVLLLGDGTYDFKNYWGRGALNYVPPFMKVVDPWLGEVAADNQYVCMDGADDRMPDMFLGRIAVNTGAQATAAVSKTLDYEGVPQDVGWNKKLLFTADNTPDPQNAGDFPAHSDALIDNHLPAPYEADKVYLDDYCSPRYTPCPEATDDLIVAVDEGRLLINYIGHGGTRQWAPERLLFITDVDRMSNPGRYPITLAMTCSEGNFAHHMGECLSETLQRAADKGAVATWSMTGFGTVTGHDWLNTAFFDAIFKDDVREIGPATLAGKLNLWENGNEDHLLDIALIFGDPALRINALDPDLRINKKVEPPGQVDPGDVLTYTLTFSNAAAEGAAHHVVISDILDPLLVSPTLLYADPPELVQREGVTYAWTLDELWAGEGGEIQIRAVVSPTTGPAAILNEARIDSPLSGDVVSVTTGVQVPDMYVTKSGPEAAAFSQIITYTISWGNVGRADAPDVRLTDNLPPWVSYVDDSSGWPHSEPSPGVIVWELGPNPVPTEAHETFFLTAWVEMDPDMVGPLINRVSIESDMPDGDPFNSRDVVSTTLLLPDLAIQTGGPETALSRSWITFTVFYSNVGDVAAANVAITDVLPPGVRYLGDDSGFSHTESAPGTHVWQVSPAELSPGEGGAFSLVGEVGKLAETGDAVTNTLEIGAATPDTDHGNDMDRWVTDIVGRFQYYLPRVFLVDPRLK